MIDSIITFGNKNSKDDNLIQTNLQLTAALLKCKVGAQGIQGLPPWATSLWMEYHSNDWKLPATKQLAPWRKQGVRMATIMLVGYERNWKFEITCTTFVMVLASITCCLCFGASGSVFPIKIQILHRGSIPPVMSTEKELSRT